MFSWFFLKFCNFIRCDNRESLVLFFRFWWGNMDNTNVLLWNFSCTSLRIFLCFCYICIFLTWFLFCALCRCLLFCFLFCVLRWSLLFCFLLCVLCWSLLFCFLFCVLCWSFLFCVLYGCLFWFFWLWDNYFFGFLFCDGNCSCIFVPLYRTFQCF